MSDSTIDRNHSMQQDPPPDHNDGARTIDALFEEGFDPANLDLLTGVDRTKAEEVLRLLSRLDALPAGQASSDLVPMLMQRIDEVEKESQRRMRIDAPVRRRRWLRVPDLATIAAIVVLGVGVGWPLVQSARSASMREQCERNMASVHSGLARYAADNGGRLPLTAGFASMLDTAGEAPRPTSDATAQRVDWRTYRHGDNLETLCDRSYIGHRCLTCPGCANDRGAMALRVPAVGQRFSLATMKGMLVADANPAIERLRAGEPPAPAFLDSSLNHRGRGQNVLFDDGSVRWLLSPVRANGDSIWSPGTPGDATALDRGQLPRNDDDVFLAQ